MTNREQPPTPAHLPVPARAARAVTAEDVTDAVLAGAWVIDVRDPAAAPAGPQAAAAYAGWLLPCVDDVVVLADGPSLPEPAVRRLARIGVDASGSTAGTHGEDRSGSYRRATWAEHRAPAPAGAARVLVDVRERDEWEDAHLPGAFHLPLHDVERAASRLPDGELWVYCRSGRRAGVAADLLQRLGRAVVHVDDAWAQVADLAVPPGHRAA